MNFIESSSKVFDVSNQRTESTNSRTLDMYLHRTLDVETPFNHFEKIRGQHISIKREYIQLECKINSLNYRYFASTCS